MEQPRVLVILGSIREGRNGQKVADWFMRIAQEHAPFPVELADLKDFPFKLFDSAKYPMMGVYDDPLVKKWAALIGRMDGFIIISPEYNHGPPGALKNALDVIYPEWNNKPVAFIGYGGGAGGARAVQQLRQIAIELQMAPIREDIIIPFYHVPLDTLGENAFLNKKALSLLTQLDWWAKALKTARAQKV